MDAAHKGSESALEQTPAPKSREHALLELAGAMVRELRPASPRRAMRLSDTLDRDLGLDSLSRAELVMRIERAFRVRLPESLVGEARTMRDVLVALERAAPLAASAVAARPPPVLPEVVGLPDDATTIVQAFCWHLERHPEREHVTLVEADDAAQTFSFERMFDDATTIAAGLAASGVVRGDRVALMLPTGAAFFQAFLGTMLAGAVPVPLYPPFRWSQIEEHVRGRAAILANCGAKLLVTVREALFVARAARAGALAQVIDVERLRERATQTVRQTRAGELALLQYTSGSTGDPKGVALTHANLLANIRTMGRAAAVRSSDRFVSWLPLYHDMGLIGAWLATMYHAVPLVVMPPHRFLARPARWLRTIDHYRATISAGPNFAYEMAASKIPDDDLAGLDLSSWRLAFNGAEPVRADTLAKFAARFGPFGFDARAMTPVYGLAESAVGLAFPPLGRGPRIDRIDADVLARDGAALPAGPNATAVFEAVSCGRPLAGHEIRIVDASETERPSRSEGRIEFRGPSATAGYFANPQATRKLMRNGWLDTGDVGYIADGELYVTSRDKDLIKRGGHTLHPYDLEAAIGELPGVRKGCVAVFGTTDRASATERVVVVAEARELSQPTRDLLRSRIAELATVHLGAPADEVIVVAPHTVLKTSSGKIRRSACRDLYERGMLEAPRRHVATQVARLLWRTAAEQVRRAWRAAARTAYGVYAVAVAFVLAAAGLAVLTVLPDLSLRLRFARFMASTMLRLAGLRVGVQGVSHLEAQPHAIVVANHASYTDVLVLTAVLPPTIRWAAKSEFATMPLMGFILRRLGTHFVARDDTLRGIEDTRNVEGAVAGGETVGFFPEGTFSRIPGLGPFRLGAFVVAARCVTPVLPVVVRGTRSLLREGRWLPERHPLSVSVQPALRPDGSDWSAAVRLRDATRAVMLAQCGEPDLAS